jgi:hypothetical protein
VQDVPLAGGGRRDNCLAFHRSRYCKG